MGVCSSITTGTRNKPDCICPFKPLLDGKNVTVATSIESNVTEFSNIKIGVVNLLPYSQEFDRITRTLSQCEMTRPVDSAFLCFAMSVRLI